MATYDRAWLRTETASHLHDKQLTDAQLDTFIDIGALRIGQMLESYTNQVVTDWQIDDELNDLPADLVTLRTVRYPQSRGLTTLKSAPAHRIELYSDRSGGQPAYYALSGDKIRVRPFVAGVYELTYWATVQIDPAETDSNPSVFAYPFLFLHAAVEAGQRWKQDEEQRALMEQTWMAEVREINRVAGRRDAGDVPAQRAI